MVNTTRAVVDAETERSLVQIWREVLNVQNVDVDDDFFTLGGDSLSAMRCINRINAVFGVQLPIDLFLLTPASIAYVGAELARLALPSEPQVNPASETEPPTKG